LTGTELFLALAAGLLAVALLVVLMRGRRDGASEPRAQMLEAHVTELARQQSELTGRLAAMGEALGQSQEALNRTLSERLEGMSHKLSESLTDSSQRVNQVLSERLDGMTHRLGESLTDTGQRTQESLAKMQERLAVIDAARGHIEALSGQVIQLQQILSNKQARGAFGQGRMEAIISDGLPKNGYIFQCALKSGVRPDCLIHMPNGAPPLVIDAKFPLEGYEAVRAAENEDGLKTARSRFRTDVIKHITDIKERYLVPGETQDTAFMFVPSESVFAEIHESFEDVIQRAHRARIVIVSPSLLMLSIQVIQAVMKDARMREQAHVIQDEVRKLLEDVGRLDDRVRKLQSHFGQTQKDVEMILTSTGKVLKRGERIDEMDFDEKAIASPQPAALLAGE
jgi:DNA recombination protein RmuC